jgi:hypothetical protein
MTYETATGWLLQHHMFVGRLDKTSFAGHGGRCHEIIMVSYSGRGLMDVK